MAPEWRAAWISLDDPPREEGAGEAVGDNVDVDETYDSVRLSALVAAPRMGSFPLPPKVSAYEDMERVSESIASSSNQTCEARTQRVG